MLNKWEKITASRHKIFNKNPYSQTHIIEPYHLGELVSWYDPFFYEDENHVFYVTTEKIRVPIPQSDIYIAETPKKSFAQVSPLVIEKSWLERPGLREMMEERLHDLGIDDIGGGGDPIYVERFVTEDAYINRGLGTLGTVQFGEKVIGPAGSMMRNLQKM